MSEAHSIVGSWASAAPMQPPAPLEPNIEQARAFFDALFPLCSGENIHFRGVAEPRDGRTQHNLHYALDDHFASNLAGYLEWAKVDQRAAFFLPGIVRGQGTGKADVLSLPALLVDFDKGEPDASLAEIERLIGPATAVVESGGKTDDGNAKLHAYWKVKTADTNRVDELCALREALALRFGGDPAFKQAAQVIRVPGSIHFKGEPKLVRLRVVRPEAVYSLDEIAAVVPPIARKSNVINFFDFNDVAPDGPTVDRVLLEPVHAGAIDDITRFDAASKAIGHYIRQVREGRMSPEACWTAVVQWNAAMMVPPWDEDRLRHDFERLLQRDIEENGPLVAVAPAIQTAATGLRLTDWYARDRFIGKAPERRWLVDGVIPCGTPGVFAAVGDAGKSMMALRLANIVASHPAPTMGPNSPAGVSDTPSFFGQPIVGRGTAVFLTGEDDADEVHRRLDAIDPSGAWRAPQSRLIVLPLLSAGGARAVITSGPRGPEFTPAWYELRAQLESLPELALVVLDPLTLFVGGDTSDNAVGAALMGELNHLAAKTGAAAMLVHHFAKAAKITNLSDARNAVLGAGAWVNNGRWGVVMWEAGQDEAYSVLKSLGRASQARQAGLVYYGGLTKGNAPAAKVQRTLVRDMTNGLLVDMTDDLRQLAMPSGDVDAALHKALLEHRNRRDRFSFTKSATALWDAWEPFITMLELPVTKDGKGRNVAGVRDVFDRMLARGMLAETADRGKTARYEPVETAV